MKTGRVANTCHQNLKNIALNLKIIRWFVARVLPYTYAHASQQPLADAPNDLLLPDALALRLSPAALPATAV